MLIDIYTHIFPGNFFDQMSKAAPRLENIGKRMQAVVPVHNLNERFRQMDRYGDYKQLISLPNPPLEDIMDPETGTFLAGVANDAMAEECAQNPDRFVGFAAALCMTDMDKAMKSFTGRLKTLVPRACKFSLTLMVSPSTNQDTFHYLMRWLNMIYRYGCTQHEEPKCQTIVGKIVVDMKCGGVLVGHTKLQLP